MKSFAKQSIQVVPLWTEFPPEPRANPAKKIQLVMPGLARIPDGINRDDVLLLPEERDLAQARRLVVLVPSGDVDENIMARRVWELAVASNLEVLYLALSPNNEETPYHRRRLTDLVMMTTSGEVQVHLKVIVTNSWLKAVGQVYQAGDMMVCLANHRNFYNLSRRRMLGEQLAHTIGVPVYMLGGVKLGQTPELRSLVREVFAWTSSLALMITFFFLQMGIGRSITRPLSAIFLGLSVMVEIYILVKINSWIG